MFFSNGNDESQESIVVRTFRWNKPDAFLQFICVVFPCSFIEVPSGVRCGVNRIWSPISIKIDQCWLFGKSVITVRLVVMDKLFVVTETKQKSGLYSLFHLPEFNVPFDLTSKTKGALFVSAHDTSVSPLMLLLEYFQFTWWLLKSPMTIVG